MTTDLEWKFRVINRNARELVSVLKPFLSKGPNGLPLWRVDPTAQEIKALYVAYSNLTATTEAYFAHCVETDSSTGHS